MAKLALNAMMQEGPGAKVRRVKPTTLDFVGFRFQA